MFDPRTEAARVCQQCAVPSSAGSVHVCDCVKRRSEVNTGLSSQQVRRMVQRLISDMKAGRKNVRSTTVTGHSLGGALAVLCADDVGRQLQAQQRLDHAVRSSSELLERCRGMTMPAEARDAIDEMEQSLAHARGTSEDVGLSRTSAAGAVDAACEASACCRRLCLGRAICTSNSDERSSCGTCSDRQRTSLTASCCCP